MNRRLFMRHTLSVGLGFAGFAAWQDGDAVALPASAWPASSPFMPQVPYRQPPRQTLINVKHLGAKGDGRSDDTAAIQKALADFDRVYLPPGTYLVNNVQLKSGNELFGAGQASVIRQAPGAHYAVSANPGRGGTPNPRHNLSNLAIHHLKFLGPAGQVPFDEHVYLLNLNAVSGVIVSYCSFIGYVGDGIYLGSGNSGGLERHNIGVLVQNCLFDGVIKNNRNGVSIIDGSHISVRNCVFTRSGNSNMPAGIDIEPDPVQNAFVRIQDIVIDRCRFVDMGTFSMIGLTLQPQDQLGHPAQYIRITNCYAARPGGQDQMFFYLRQGDGTTPVPVASPLGLVISNCRSDGIPTAMTVLSVKGMQVFNCAFNQAQVPQLRNSVDCRFANVRVNGSLFQPG